jgi:hypothetical protein
MPQYVKAIVYDREARDYAMYLDGELIGFARTYHEGEITLDTLVHELRRGTYAPDATAPGLDVLPAMAVPAVEDVLAARRKARAAD